MPPCVSLAITRRISSIIIIRLDVYSSCIFDRIVIVSDEFKGKMPVQRHRMVYSLLDDEFRNGLHAVNIIAKTPAEFEKTGQ